MRFQNFCQLSCTLPCCLRILLERFLLTEASSASAERLFSVSGNYEGSRRHLGDSVIEEMLFTIRSHANQRVSNSRAQSAFISGKDQSTKELEEEIAVVINSTN